ncbi:MAG: putative Zn-dependent protease with MMP-like domain [Nitriliruptoraceae bacterium]|jgi:predicted Zn-dependent protease with MMP-like domain
MHEAPRDRGRRHDGARHERHRRRPDDPRRHPGQGWRTSSADRFDRMVGEAIGELPPFILGHLQNVAIVVEDVPPGDELLLGLYEGVPRTDRDGFLPPLPDCITLYRRPLEARALHKAELKFLIAETLVHEIAHHVGIDDDRLDELGWA